MTIERNNIAHLMWRKKVDNSVFEGETVIPIAFVKQWNLKKHFRDTGLKVENWSVQIKFASKLYEGKYFTGTLQKHVQASSTKFCLNRGI